MDEYAITEASLHPTSGGRRSLRCRIAIERLVLALDLFTVAASPSDELSPSFIGVVTGSYQLWLYAVDAAGTRSTSAPCSQDGAASQIVHYDTTPPPAELVGAMLDHRGKQRRRAPRLLVRPALYFVPPVTVPDLAPINGYYFELTSDDGAEFSRCSIAINDGLATQTPAASCAFSRTTGDQVRPSSRASPTPAD